MNKILITLFLILILYGLYNAQQKSTPRVEKPVAVTSLLTAESKLLQLENELSQIDSVRYAQEYIVEVINSGSSVLGFVGGVMEGGFASRDDAGKIASYVLTLSGKKPLKTYPPDAQMFYTSNCGGCHSDDGKGLGGNYPDLTRKMLLGIERRKESIKMQIKRMQSR